MSLQIFTPVRTFTKKTSFLVLLVVCVSSIAEAWQIDLSRRRKQLVREVASEPTEASQGDPSFLEKVFAVTPKQEIVILNTEKGFVPSVVRVPSGSKYTVHVVNVNKKNQNLSFVMDYFGEHHGTFYGNVKSFSVDAKKEGIFSYQCPEMAFEGRFVVFQGEGVKTDSMVPGIPSKEKKADPMLRELASDRKQ